MADYNINIDTTAVQSTVRNGVNPQLEDIRDYVNKIPTIVGSLALACKCEGTSSVISGMSKFRSNVSNHVEGLDDTGKAMVDIAQTHEELDAKLAGMSYHS